MLELFGHPTGLGLVGFVVPATVSLLILVVLLYSRDTLALRLFAVDVWLTGLVFFTLLMSPTYVVRIANTTPSGGGGGLYSVFMSFSDLLILLSFSYKWDLAHETARTSAVFYISGFLIGATSDLLYAKIRSGIMGGFGVFDGDFMFPLGFVLSALCFSSFVRRYQKTGEKQPTAP